MTETELLLDSLRRLNGRDLPHLVTGSMASNAWGIPRTTHGLDFLIQLPPGKVTELVGAFEGGDYAVNEEMVRNAFRPPHMFNVLHPSSGLKLDFWILRPEDDSERQMFARRVQIDWLGELAWVATAEDIILHKLLWNKQSPSERQRGDIAGVVAVQKNQLDEDYLRHWAGKLGVVEGLEAALSGQWQPQQT